MNYEFERETGFINSQPSLAECLTSFPPVADAFQSSSIKSSTLSRSTLIPPPFEQTIPRLNPGSHPRHSRPKQNPNGLCPLPAASLPPEYPWMKEKKASKKPQTSAAATTDPAPLYFSPEGKNSNSVSFNFTSQSRQTKLFYKKLGGKGPSKFFLPWCI